MGTYHVQTDSGRWVNIPDTEARSPEEAKALAQQHFGHLRGMPEDKTQRVLQEAENAFGIPVPQAEGVPWHQRAGAGVLTALTATSVAATKLASAISAT